MLKPNRLFPFMALTATLGLFSLTTVGFVNASTTRTTAPAAAARATQANPSEPLTTTDASQNERMVRKWVLAVSAHQAGDQAAAQQAAAQAAAAQAAEAARQATLAQQAKAVPSPQTASSGSGGVGDYAAWTKISICENGAPGWNPPQGSAFPDSIGFTAANWQQFGGGSDLSPATQIAVGNRFMAYYHMALPDQNGCGGGY